MTSLPLSKELWEKGLKLETEKLHFVHKQFDCADYKDCLGITDSKNLLMYPKEYWDVFPTPSTDELLEVLPKRYESVLGWCNLEIICEEKGFIVGYYPDEKAECMPLFKTDMVLCETLGKMCLWLLENGYHYNPEKRRLER